MIKNILLVVFICCFISCEKNTPKNEETAATKEITSNVPTEPEETEVWEPKPPTVVPGKNNMPPSDAIVLFDGTNLDQWISVKDSLAPTWILNGDGSMTVKNGAGNIQTKKAFGDIQLHLEWRSSAEIRADGQNRSNSGVFFQKRYEIQVLDNNDNDTYVNGQVGAIYKQTIPLAMASVLTGEWNTYDIVYHAPVFDSEGEKAQSGTITVVHNGILIQDHAEIMGTTEYIGWPKNNAHGKAPLQLQDHNDRSGVSYRNIWVREL